ncbi:MAG TPA: DUF3857 domain-containing protein [Thermoanaerobaculia bacterium]|nr:DUF3857 domain-containing protein [Thermoanaerobaculia bacterium]
MPHSLVSDVRPFPKLSLFVLAAALFCCWPANAANTAEPWEGPAFAAAPAMVLRAASELPETAGGGVDVLLHETFRSFDEAGRETFRQRLIYRFGDATAHESWSTVEQAWSPWHQDRPQLQARVITADGAEHRLDPATIAENATSQEAPDMFEDGRVLRAPLPATGRGAVVEQEVTLRETAPFFDGGTVGYSDLQISVPVRHVRLVLEAPAGLPLRWLVRGLPGTVPLEQISDGRRRLTFDLRDMPAYEESEPGLPPEVPRIAHVAFSTGGSWSDLARRYSEIVDRTIRGAELSGFLRAAAPEGAPAESQLETINLLLSRLGREVRYTGVELGEGGVIPRPPGETLKRKFGDCKDKAVLLTALLRSLDIPAYVALLNAGEDEPDVEESLPGLGSFNHAIVMVPGNPAVWIDPTDSFARAGELPVQDQGRLALVASPTAAGLVRTPESASADNREVETREIYLSDLGGARVVETTEYWGSQEQELRSSYAEAAREDLRDALEEYASEAYLADELTDLDYSDPADLSQPFRLRLEAEGAARGTTDVREAAVAIFLSAFAERLPAELTGGDEDAEEEEDAEIVALPRQHDYVFSRPLQLEVRYRIVPPAGFTARPLPSYRMRQFASTKLEEAYSIGKDGVVEAVLRFDTGKRRLSPTELAALREGLRKLSEEKPVMITFDQVGEAHLAAARVREALDEFRRLAALAPNRALPRTRMARALLAGGLGEPARREAEQAVKLEPDFAYAWTTLGWIRQHDDFGRRFAKGFDRAGAIAAYRKAKELDPDDLESRGDLAILLEHDAEGGRYTPGSDLAAAIAEYEELKEGLEDLGLPNNLLIALMWAQRFGEMKELLGELETNESRATLRLVVLAATEGPEAALQDADRAFADGEARANALSNAGRNLMLLRRYNEAAALFERAGRQSAKAATALGLAEVLRKTHRFEETTYTASDPVGAVRRVMSLSVATTGREEPARYVSRALLRGMDDEGRQEFWKGFESSLAAAAKAAKAADVPLTVAMDLGLAAMRDTVSGDDALGYRVVMASTMGNAHRTVAFLVPEEGEYRVAASGKELSLLGSEALRRIESGDLRGARQWLDWAFEELERGRLAAPSQASPFLALWTKGMEADAEQARCAAASLLGGESSVKRLLPTLTACRQAASEGPRQLALDRTLLAAHLSLRQHQEAADLLRRLLQAEPDSEPFRRALVGELTRLQRWDELRQLADARLAKDADDVVAQEVLVELALRNGDFDRAEAISQRILDSGKAGADQYNESAWLSLFRGHADERAMEMAQRAAGLSDYQDYGILHTLASVYVEQGKTGEAYRLILQALEIKDSEPGVSDWYVFGRLAEHYGLPDVARDYYEKAYENVRGGAEEDASPISTIHLVRKRLEELGKPPEPKQVASRL